MVQSPGYRGYIARGFSRPRRKPTDPPADRRNIQSGPERRARKGRGVVDAARSGTGTTDAHERGKNILDDVEIKKYLRRRIAAGAEHPIVDVLAARCGKGRTRVHGLYHYNCISDVRAAETYA